MERNNKATSEEELNRMTVAEMLKNHRSVISDKKDKLDRYVVLYVAALFMLLESYVISSDYSIQMPGHKLQKYK